MPEAGEAIETTMLPLKGALLFNKALSGRFRHFRGQVYRLPKRNYSAIHSKQGCHCERALFASEAVSQSMVFPVQHEIASGKKRPRNDSLNSYAKTKNLPYRQILVPPRGEFSFGRFRLFRIER
ncbi:MAG: hypothetical protein J7555_07135 [Chloroflexi bacterium]|nr:hypothetical protein [Chloroflexota bacterium]